MTEPLPDSDTLARYAGRNWDLDKTRYCVAEAFDAFGQSYAAGLMLGHDDLVAAWRAAAGDPDQALARLRAVIRAGKLVVELPLTIGGAGSAP